MFLVEEWKICAIEVQLANGGSVTIWKLWMRLAAKYTTASAWSSAHPVRSGHRRGKAGTHSPGAAGSGARHSVCRCPESSPGAGLLSSWLTARWRRARPSWTDASTNGHLAVKMLTTFLAGGHCIRHQLSVPDQPSWRTRQNRPSFLEAWARGAEHPAGQLCGQPRQRHHERQLHRHPVLGLPVGFLAMKKDRCREHQLRIAVFACFRPLLLNVWKIPTEEYVQW